MTKLQKQILSVIFFFGVMTFYIGWKMSLVLTFSIVIHEYGHLLIAQKLGYSTDGMYLIPFIGGVSSTKENFKSYYDMFLIKVAGPMVGLFVALLCSIVGYHFKSPICTAISLLMLIMNGFNLLPLSILDGGGILEAIVLSIHKKIGIILIFILNILGFLLLVKMINLFIAIFISIYTTSYLIYQYKQFNIKELQYSKIIGKQFIYVLMLLVLAIILLYILMVYIGLSYKNLGISPSNYFLPLK